MVLKLNLSIVVPLFLYCSYQGFRPFYEDKYYIYSVELEKSLDQGECINGYKYHTVLEYYYCDGVQVPKYVFKEWETDYKDDKTYEGNCFAVELARSLCYCPVDFFGLKCEHFLPFKTKVIEIEQRNKECVDKYLKEFEFQNQKNLLPCHFYDDNNKYSFW